MNDDDQGNDRGCRKMLEGGQRCGQETGGGLYCQKHTEEERDVSGVTISYARYDKPPIKFD